MHLESGNGIMIGDSIYIMGYDKTNQLYKLKVGSIFCFILFILLLCVFL